MADENNSNLFDEQKKEDYTADLEAFRVVVSAMQLLDQAARSRLLSTVAAFFGMSVATSKSSIGSSPSMAGHVSNVSEENSFSADRSISPKEFLLQKRPILDIERVACLAYYLTHYRDTPHFKTLDLSKLNTEAAQIKFSNAAKAVDNAARAGFLASATKGNKQLSVIGELFVQNLPDRDAAKAAIAHAKPRRRRRNNRQSASSNEAADE